MYFGKNVENGTTGLYIEIQSLRIGGNTCVAYCTQSSKMSEDSKIDKSLVQILGMSSAHDTLRDIAQTLRMINSECKKSNELQEKLLREFADMRFRFDILERKIDSVETRPSVAYSPSAARARSSEKTLPAGFHSHNEILVSAVLAIYNCIDVYLKNSNMKHISTTIIDTKIVNKVCTVIIKVNKWETSNDNIRTLGRELSTPSGVKNLTIEEIAEIYTRPALSPVMNMVDHMIRTIIGKCARFFPGSFVNTLTCLGHPRVVDNMLNINTKFFKPSPTEAAYIKFKELSHQAQLQDVETALI